MKLHKDADNAFLPTALTKIMQALTASELCVDLRDWYGLGLGLRDKAWILNIQAQKLAIKEQSINIMTHEYEEFKATLLTGHTVFNNSSLMKVVRAIR